jgi:hypothetical protein
MRTPRTTCLSLTRLAVLAALSCGRPAFKAIPLDAAAGTMDTSRILPQVDGTCPAPTSPCGSGTGARCYALGSDPANCGACGHACMPGIACAGGACQQAQCVGPVTFEPIASFPVVSSTDYTGTAPNPQRLAGFLSADMNRDGQMDLLEYDEAGDVAIWLGQGDGTFVVASSYETVGQHGPWLAPGHAAAADYNEDGLIDLLVQGPQLDSVRMRSGLAGGGLGGAPGAPLPGWVSGDLDGDGHLDAIAGYGEPGGSEGFTVLRGRGDGSFAKAGSYPIANDSIGRLRLGDWDGNGTLDVIVLGTTVHVALGLGDGTFAPDQRCGLGVDLDAVIFEDLNRDGTLDVLWRLWPAASLGLVLGLGGCRFSARTDYATASQGTAMAGGDLSGDGILDMVVVNTDEVAGHWADTGKTVVLRGVGDGTFVAEPPLSVFIPGRLFVADVTSDGRADVVAASEKGILVFANTCMR